MITVVVRALVVRPDGHFNTWEREDVIADPPADFDVEAYRQQMFAEYSALVTDNGATAIAVDGDFPDEQTQLWDLATSQAVPAPPAPDLPGFKVAMTTAVGIVRANSLISQNPAIMLMLEAGNWPLARIGIEQTLAAGGITAAERAGLIALMDAYHLGEPASPP